MFDLSLKECFCKVQETRGDKKIVLTHVFRSPTLEDWTFYFKGTTQLGVSKGRDTVEMSNVSQEKDSLLWEDLIVRVEGYKVKGEDVMSLDDWKERIPLSHKLEAVSGFMLFWREDVPDEASLIEVNSLDLAEDSLEMHFAGIQNGYTHVIKFFFKNPEPSDHIKFSRLSSKMQLVRTKRRGESAIRVPSDITGLIDIFDRLVEKVEGYSYKGKDLMDAEKWKGFIDAYHKRAAVLEMFTSSLQETEGKVTGG